MAAYFFLDMQEVSDHASWQPAERAFSQRSSAISRWAANATSSKATGAQFFPCLSSSRVASTGGAGTTRKNIAILKRFA